MATSNFKVNLPLGTADADCTAKRYHIVKITGADTVDQAVSATASANLGVLDNAPKLGKMAAVTVFGEQKVVAGAAITAGALITSTASGRATPAASGDWAIGRALEAATADGDVITAIINPFRLGGAI